MDWLKIGSAVLIVAMLIFVWPSAKRMMHESPAAEKGDWQAAVLPILAVVGFVMLLLWLV
ncbi:MAG: hypothetical protein QF609_08555 [Gammaproteobacteria bacterium]|jgi:hypothetical protein|nr:hypothetical protein [Gammaproteobacteria bacterium]|tara:strand:+ start:53 stop:232 length:180 start_codon:yes stop_codon:yes gene_type:complete